MLDWANQILKPFSELCGEDKWPFAESSVWPDKVKDQNYWMMANWHYSDNVVLKEGYVPPPSPVNEVRQNITWAIGSCIGTLKSTSTDVQGKSNSILLKSISLRNLIHFIGDIHQPMHTTSQISSQHPNGDLGGLLFTINHYTDPTINNLHFFWDHMMDMGREINSPIDSDDDNNWLTSFSQSLMDLNPYDKLLPQMKANWSVVSWEIESMNYVKDFVYSNIVMDEDPSPEYQSGGKAIIKKVLTLAGYRIAETLKSIYYAIKPSKMAKKKAKTAAQVEVSDLIIH